MYEYLEFFNCLCPSKACEDCQKIGSVCQLCQTLRRTHQDAAFPDLLKCRCMNDRCWYCERYGKACYRCIRERIIRANGPRKFAFCSCAGLQCQRCQELLMCCASCKYERELNHITEVNIPDLAECSCRSEGCRECRYLGYGCTSCIDNRLNQVMDSVERARRVEMERTIREEIAQENR